MLIKGHLFFAIFLSLFFKVSTEDFFDDWSAFNESEKTGKRGGVIVEITQKGLDFISSLAVAGLRNSNFTNENAKIVVRFIKDSGIGGKIFLPKGVINGDKDFAIQILINIGKSVDGYPILNLPYCQSKSGDIRLGSGTFVNVQNDDPCSKIQQLFSCWNSRGSASCIGGMNFLSNCQMPRDWRINASALAHGRQSAQSHDKFLESLTQFSINHRLLDQPQFENDHILLQLQGSFLYKNISSNITHTPMLLDRSKSDGMIRQYMNEHVWNTLFAHIYQQNFISYEEKFSMSSLPGVIRLPLEAVCWSCRAKTIFRLLQSPVMNIDSNGMRIQAKFRIQVKASGILYDATIMNGRGQLNASVVPTIIDDQIKVNLSIDDLKIEAETGMASYYMPNQFGKSIEHWIENKISPTLHAVAQVGFNAVRLGGICGFHTENVGVDFVDGAVVVNTDFRHDFIQNSTWK